MPEQVTCVGCGEPCGDKHICESCLVLGETVDAHNTTEGVNMPDYVPEQAVVRPVGQVDLDTLHPAPWDCEECPTLAGAWLVVDANRQPIPALGFLQEWLARRIVAWRNAEEIQMRRDWCVGPNWIRSGKPMLFSVFDDQQHYGSDEGMPTPAEAIIAAEEWCKANVEGKHASEQQL